MHTSNRNYAHTIPFVAALAGLGMQHVAITPGSRNTPLAFAFAANDAITDWSHHDERSAAFFALGMARATGVPVGLVCTSGTAAAEYLPALVEAFHSRVPLIVMTADRPPEERGIGGPQTIEQRHLYGTAVKWFHESHLPTPTDESRAAFVALAGRVWSEALITPAGPVHLNMPFQDPLAPEPMPGDVPPGEARLPSYSAIPPAAPGKELVEQLYLSIRERRALAIAGSVSGRAFASAAADLADRARIPIIADPLSGLRAGGHGLANVITTADWLVGRGDLDGDLRPDFIVRFGGAPTSKRLNNWLADRRAIPQVLIDDAGWRDPGSSADQVIHAEPATAAAVLAARMTDPGSEEWVEGWRRAEAEVSALLTCEFPSEPALADLLRQHLPEQAILYIGSSMPIRVVDGFFRTVPTSITMLGNRGANGIDGLVSSALGAAAGTGRPTFVYVGDVSLLHDLTSLATAARLNIPLTVLLVNNDGGGIFHMLAQADYPEHFEKHLATPHGLDFAAISRAFGVEYHAPADSSDLADLIGRPAECPRLIEIRTNREESAALLRALRHRVGGAPA